MDPVMEAMSPELRRKVLEFVGDLVKTVNRVDIAALDKDFNLLTRDQYEAKPGETIRHRYLAPKGTSWFEARMFTPSGMELFTNTYPARQGNTFSYIVPSQYAVRFEE